VQDYVDLVPAERALVAPKVVDVSTLLDKISTERRILTPDQIAKRPVRVGFARVDVKVILRKRPVDGVAEHADQLHVWNVL
jgi:hypothetical protein